MKKLTTLLFPLFFCSIRVSAQTAETVADRGVSIQAPAKALDALYDRSGEIAVKAAALENRLKEMQAEEKTSATPTAFKGGYTPLYTELSKLYLTVNQGAQAEAVAWQGIQKDKTANALFCNLAHSYLLQGKWSQAEALYIRLKDAYYDRSKKTFCKEILTTDFNQFEKLGIALQDLPKAKAAIK